MARTHLNYGESGTYKTSQLGPAADYQYELTGGITRLITADSGVAPIADQIRRGVIQPWNLKASKIPLPLLMKASNGYWPDRINPHTFIADESSLRLTKPTEWVSRPLNEGEEPTNGVAATGVEGLSMIAEILMGDLTTKQRDTGEPMQSKFTEGGEHFGLASRGSYKFIQDHTKIYITNFSSLPCHRLFVTAHESKGEDNFKRLAFGPAVIGKSATDKIPAWFENSLHHESYMMEFKDPDGITRTRPGVRMFFTRHPDPEVPNIYWPCKLGVEPKVAAAIRNRWRDSYIPLIMSEAGELTSSLATFLKMIDDTERELANASE